VDNAYCYEYFVADVIKAEKERVPKLPPKKEVVPECRDLVDLDWDERNEQCGYFETIT